MCDSAVVALLILCSARGVSAWNPDDQYYNYTLGNVSVNRISETRYWYWALDDIADNANNPMSSNVTTYKSVGYDSIPNIEAGFQRNCYAVRDGGFYGVHPKQSNIFSSASHDGYTVVFAFHPNSLIENGTQMVLTSGGEDVQATGFHVVYHGGTSEIEIRASSYDGVYEAARTMVNPGDWTHVAFAVDPYGPAIMLSINGVYHASPNGTTSRSEASLLTYSELRIGSAFLANSHEFMTSDFLLDELHVYDDVISLAAMTDLYESSLENTAIEVSLDMDRVYENNLVSGTAQARVVKGTVTQIPGMYGGGLRLEPLSTLSLGIHTDCFGFPALSHTTDDTWCRNGFSFAFWIRIHLHQNISHGESRYVFGNSDVLAPNPHAGFMVYYTIISDTSATLQVRFVNPDFTNAISLNTVDVGNWYRVLMTYNLYIGGYRLDISERRYNKYYATQGEFDDMFQMDKLTDTHGDGEPLMALFIGHPEKGGYFDVDEVAIRGEMWNNEQASAIDEPISYYRRTSTSTDYDPGVQSAQSPILYEPNHNAETANDAHRSSYYLVDTAMYYDGETAYTMLPDGVFKPCFHNTQCKRGTTLTFWLHIPGVPSQDGRVYVADSGALQDDSWGFTLYYEHRQLHAVVNNQVRQWTGAVDFGLEQWTSVILAWYPSVGFSFRINGEFHGVWTNSTRRNGTHSRLTDVSQDLYFGAPYGTRADNLEGLHRMTIHELVLLDRASNVTSEATNQGVYIDNSDYYTYRYLGVNPPSQLYTRFTENYTNHLDVVNGSWVVGSPPYVLIGNASLTSRNDYFGNAVTLGGGTGALQSDKLVSSCLTTPHVCYMRNHLLSFWVKPLDLHGGVDKTLLWAGTASTTVLRLQYQQPSSTFFIYAHSESCSMALNIPAEDWSHVMIYFEFRDNGKSIDDVFGYVDGALTSATVNCVENISSNPTENTGHVVFGAELDGSLFANHVAAQIDDVKIMSTFEQVEEYWEDKDENWMLDAYYLSNITAAHLYLADNCITFMNAGFKNEMPWFRVSPYLGEDWYIKCKRYADTGLIETEIPISYPYAHNVECCTEGRQPYLTPYYAVSQQGINIIKASSAKCSQYLSYSCAGATLFRDQNSDTYWTDFNGTAHYYWAGSNIAHNCLCGSTATCLDPGARCNCDGRAEDAIDAGYITDRSLLPISNLKIENTGGTGNWSVGSLICHNMDDEGFHWSMDTLNIHEELPGKPGTLVSPTSAQLVPGVVENAILLDGTANAIWWPGTYTQCMYDINQCANGFSISFFLKIDSSDMILASNLVEMATGKSGFQLYQMTGATNLEIYELTNVWTVQFRLAPNVWTFLCVVWSSSGPEVYVNAVELSSIGVPVIYTENFNNNAPLVIDQKLWLGHDDVSPDMFAHMVVDDLWFSPSAYVQRQVTERYEVSLKTYAQSFDAVVSTVDVLTRSDLVFHEMGNVSTVTGYIDESLSLSGQPDSKIEKRLMYECLVMPSFCQRGMTFSVWLFIDSSHWNNATESFALFSTLDLTNVRSEGLQMTTRGRNATLEIREYHNPQTAKQYLGSFDIPIGKWVHVVFSWGPDRNMTLWLNGFQVLMSVETSFIAYQTQHPPNAALTFGWSPQLPDSYTKMTVDDFHFYERIDPEEQSLVDYLYLRSPRQYIFAFEDSRQLGDIALVGPGTPRLVRGRVGEAIYLQSDAYLRSELPLYGECLSQPDLCKAGFTLSFWVNLLPPFSDRGCIFSTHNGHHGISLYYYTHPIDSSLVEVEAKVSRTDIDDVVRFSVPKIMWTHVGVTWTHQAGMDSSVWLDGGEVGVPWTPVPVFPPRPTQDVYMYIGSDTTNNITNMAIDELIFKETLSTTNDTYNEYVVGSERSDEFHWPLDFIEEGGLLGSDNISANYSSVTFTSAHKNAGAVFDGAASQINLGSFPGTCMTDLNFCQQLNIQFFMYFNGENRDQYILSRTTSESSMSGFYVRFHTINPMVPLRRYFQVEVKHDSKKWSVVVNIEREQWMQFQLSWSLQGGLTLVIDKLLVEQEIIGEVVGGSINELTDATPMYLGRSNNGSEDFGSVILDDLWIWSTPEDREELPYSEDLYFVGCYTQPSFPPKIFASYEMSPEICRSFCSHTYRHVAISEGMRCSCVEDLKTYTQLDLSDCSLNCSQTSYSCGASLSLYTASVYRTTSHLPFPVVELISNCSITIDGPYSYLDPTLTIVNENQTFVMNVKCENGSHIIYNYTMGDGTPFFYSENNSVEYMYTVTRGMSGSISLLNEVNTVVIPFTILVTFPLVPIVNMTLVSPVILEHGVPADVLITLSQGSDLYCLVNFGEGTVEDIYEEYYTPQLTFQHNYTDHGPYNISVVCNNSLSTEVASQSVVVQQRLGGLVIPNLWQFYLGDEIVIYWNLSSGSHYKFNISVGELNLELNQGIQSLMINNTNRVGLYNGSLYASNDISMTDPLEFTVQMEQRLDSVLITTPEYVASNTSFIASVSIPYGSNVQLEVCLNVCQSRFKLGGSIDWTGNYSLQINNPGIHTVSVRAKDPLSSTWTQNISSVIVQNPVTSLQLDVEAAYDLNDAVKMNVSMLSGLREANNVTLNITALRHGSLSPQICYQGTLSVFTTLQTDCDITRGGVYNVSVVAWNQISREEVQVVQSLGDSISGFQYVIKQSLITLGQAADISVYIDAGLGSTATVDWGDGNISLPVLVGLNHWTHVTYVYPNHGRYNIRVEVTNQISTVNGSCQLCIAVQEEVTGLHLLGPFIFTYGMPITTKFDIATGSHLQVSALVDQAHAMSILNLPSNVSGTLSISDTAVASPGQHTLTLVVWNNVTTPVTVSANVTVLKIITGLALAVSEVVIPTNAIVNSSVSFNEGTLLFLRLSVISLSDNSEETFLDTSIDDANGMFFVIATNVFRNPGMYRVKAYAENDVSNATTFTEDIVVQNPIVSVWNELLEPDTYQSPAQIIIHVNENDPEASELNFVISLGDGQSLTRSHLSNYMSTSWTAVHTYPNDGVYNITMRVFNNVSTFEVDLQMTVGIYPSDLVIAVSPLVVETGEPVAITYHLALGSNVRIYFDMGDNSNLTQSLSAGQTHQLLHTYRKPGHYQIFATATNVFDQITSNTTRVITVQDAVSIVTLTSSDEVYDVELDSALLMYTIGNGTNVSCEVEVEGTTLYSSDVCNTSWSSIIDHSLTSEVGVYTCTLSVWNLVTSRFSVFVRFGMERSIGQMHVSPHFPIWSIREVVNFTSFISQGSNATAIVSFSDGEETETKEFPGDLQNMEILTERIFNFPGQYVVVVNVSNPLGNSTAMADIVIQTPMYDGDLNAFNSDAHQIASQLQVTFNEGDIPPTDIEFQCSMGYSNVSMKHDEFIMVDYQTFIGSHLFPGDGKYNVSCHGYNNVSVWNSDLHRVQIGNPIANLSINATKFVVSTSEKLDIVIDYSEGSNVEVEVDFGDGSSIQNNNVSAGESSILHHQYQVGGVYHLHVKAWNSFGDVVEEMERYILAFEEAGYIALESDKDVYAAGDDVVLSWNILRGTNNSCDVTFNDLSYYSSQRCNNSGSVTVHGSYTSSVDVYTAKLFVWNPVTERLEHGTLFNVEQPIEGVNVTWDSEYLMKTNNESFFVTIDSGSNYEVSVWDNTGHTFNPRSFAGAIANNRIEFSNSFLVAGDVTVFVQVTNLLGMVKMSSVIPVQSSLLGLMAFANNTLGFEFDVLLTVSVRANNEAVGGAMVAVNWGDGAKTNLLSASLNHTAPLLISHNFSDDGFKTMSVLLSNSVDQVEMTAMCRVGEEIVGLYAWLDRLVVQPYESVQICFNATHGSTFTVTAHTEDGNYMLPDLISREMIGCIELSFKSPGAKSINVTASNIFNTDFTLVYMTVEKQISGLELVLPSAAVVNGTTEIAVEFITLGTFFCLLLDVGDGSQGSVYGEDDCEVRHPAHAYTKPLPGVTTFTEIHTYAQKATYDVSVYAYNKLSSVNISQSLVAVFCQKPTVSLNGLGSILELPVTAYRSQNLRFVADVVNTCATPWNVTMTWHVDVLPNGANGHNLSYPVTQLNTPTLELHPKDIWSLLPNPANTETAILAVHFRAQVGPYAGMDDSDVKYVNLVPTDLKVQLAGGLIKASSLNDPIIVDARNFTVDPDDPDQLIPMQYSWSYRIKGSLDWIILYDPTSSKRRKRALVLDASSRPGSGLLMLDPAGIMAATYEFLLQVTQGSKFGEFIQEVVVIDGVIPEVNIRCVDNCLSKVSTRVALRLESSCPDCSQYSLDWQRSWTLYRLVGSERTRVSLDANTTTGTESDVIAISGSFLQPGTNYSLRLVMEASGYSGFSEYSFATNLPPYGGSCQASPTRGVVIFNKFTIICSNWKDEGLSASRNTIADSFRQAELYYTFFQRPRGATGVMARYYYGADPSSQPSYLAMGYKANGYLVDVTVRVEDFIGDYEEFHLQVQVAEFYLKYDELGDLLSGESGELDFHYASKNLRGVTDVIGTITEQLDRRNQVSLCDECDQTCAAENSEGSSDTGNDLDRVEIRSGLVNELETALHLVDTPDGVATTASALTTIVQTPSELTDRAKTLASSLFVNMSAILINVGSAPQDVIHAVANDITAGTGHLLASLQLTSPVAPGHADTMDMDPDSKAALFEQYHHELEQNNLLAKEVVENALTTFDNIQQAALNGRLPDEDPVHFTDSINIELIMQRVSLNKAFDKQVGSDSASFQTPPSSSGVLQGVDISQVDVQVVIMVSNPFVWGGASDTLQTQLAGLKFTHPGGEEISVSGLSSPVEINLRLLDPNRAGSGHSEHVFIRNIPENTQDIVMHTIAFTRTTSALEIRLTPKTAVSEYRLYVRLDEPADTTDYDQIHDMTPTSGYNHVVIIPDDVSNGTYYVGVQQTSRLSYESLEYHFSATTRGCVYWNETTNAWQNDGCWVTTSTTPSPDTLTCSCNHLTFFGSSFAVAPNTIDFNTVWGKFANIGDNWMVLATVGGLLFLYWMVVLILRRQDKADHNKWKVRPLLDNSPDDEYYYIISVITSDKYGAATKSKVSFIIVGDDGDSDIRILDDGYRKVLEKGSCYHYLLTVPEPLGELRILRIWHDQSGRGSHASWHLQEVILHDVTRKEQSHFICNDWLSTERGDMQVERVIPLTRAADAKRFGRLFRQTARRQMTDAHLWCSVFSRPTRSTFTRVQRWSCCLSLLFTTMITSAMWYGRLEAEDDPGQLVKFGPFVWSTKQLFIATMCAIVVFPINFIIIQIFRKSAPKKDEQVMTIDDLPSTSRPTSTTKVSHVDFIENHAWPYRPDDDVMVTSADSDRKKSCTCLSRQLPHWCVYIAWLLCFLSVAASGFFCILYSMEWGGDKSGEWLTSMLIGFLESVIVIQPIKVLVVAFLLTLIFKDIDMEDDIRVSPSDAVAAGNNQPYINSRATRSKMKQKHFDLAKLLKLKEKRRKESEMEDRLSRVIFYSIFVISLWIISYGERDPNNYYLTNHIDNTLITKSFDAVKTLEMFEKWSNEIFLPQMIPDTLYNDQPIEDWRQRKYFALGDNYYKLGSTRLRQLRVRPGSCDVIDDMAFLFYECNSEYSSSAQEKESFGPEWTTPTVNQSYAAWRYRSPSETKALTTWSQLNFWYGGGGYILDHPPTLDEALADQNATFARGWLDKYTRAVISEVALFNPDANLFAWVKVILERTASGGVHPSREISVLNLYTYTGSFALFRIICELLFCVFVSVNIYKIIRSLHKNGRKEHFRGLLSYLDVIVNVLALVSVILYVVRFIMRKHVMSALSKNEDATVDMSILALYDYVFNCLVAILIAITTMRMTILLKFNARVNIFMTALSRSARPLLSFSFVFAVTMIAFSITAYLLLGSSVAGYTTVIESCESLVAGFMGARMFKQFDAGSTILGRILFLMFSLLMLCFLSNMLITIILDGVNSVKSDILKVSKEENYVQFISTRISDLLGLERFSTTHEGDSKPKRVSVGMQAGPSHLADTTRITDI